MQSSAQIRAKNSAPIFIFWLSVTCTAVDGDDVIMPPIIIIVSPWATCIYNYYMIIVHKYGNKNHTF